jgi:(p)ppGpp synthase/HD superfamily hydrolase
MANIDTDVYTEKIPAALKFAAEVHRRQIRKRTREEEKAREASGGTHEPYLSHLLTVCAITMRMPTATEEHYIAALLHDALEDQPTIPGTNESTAEAIERKFGSRVLELVQHATDKSDDGGERGPDSWDRRKRAHLEHMKRLQPDDLLVPLADKIANASSLLLDLEQAGPVVWQRFNRRPDAVAWYYDAMAETLGGIFGDTPDVQHLRALSRDISELANAEMARRAAAD